MSAIAHAPGRTWAATHRLTLLFVALSLVVAAAAVTVFLMITGDTTTTSPSAPTAGDGISGTCVHSPVPAPC